MSLVPLANQKWATVAPASSAIHHVIDAAWTCINQANDHLGVPIASPLASPQRYQLGGVTTEALHGGFAFSGKAKWMVCGAAGARTPWMATSTGGNHTYLASCIFLGLTVDPGVYQAWDHATQPFTSGRPIGLCRMVDCAVKAVKYVHAYVNAENLTVLFETTDGMVYGGGCGGSIDPESTDPLDAESDGRRYSVWTTGTIAGGITTTHNTANIQAPGGHVSNATEAHHLALTPGTATCGKINRLTSLVASTTTTLTLLSGKPVSIPLHLYDLTNLRTAGRWREWEFVRDSMMGLRQATYWEYIGGSLIANQDCLGLRK